MEKERSANSKPTVLDTINTYLEYQVIFLFCAVIYYCSNSDGDTPYDYTFRIGKAFLSGELGLVSPPPHYLNEFIPLGDRFYSVFPLGSVLSVFPFAFLAHFEWIDSFPSSCISGIIAGGIAVFAWALSGFYGFSDAKRYCFLIFLLFGNWMWCNLAFEGSWQIALGFAVLGQLAAIVFTLVWYSPIAAGFCFAMAFGNRTEIILTAPIFCYLMHRVQKEDGRDSYIRDLTYFSIPPLILGVLTLLYNYYRFSSPFDFGYARIPGVLNEPWYRDGIFSFSYVWNNCEAMLLKLWVRVKDFPYLLPSRYDGSILISSPFLVFLLRFKPKKLYLWICSWLAVVLITAVLWTHGNTGGEQYSYRYAMVLLPWFYLIFLETGVENKRFNDLLEWILVSISALISAFAVYVFYWTDYMLQL